MKNGRDEVNDFCLTGHMLTGIVMQSFLYGPVIPQKFITNLNAIYLLEKEEAYDLMEN